MDDGRAPGNVELYLSTYLPEDVSENVVFADVINVYWLNSDKDNVNMWSTLDNEQLEKTSTSASPAPIFSVLPSATAVRTSNPSSDISSGDNTGPISPNLAGTTISSVTKPTLSKVT